MGLVLLMALSGTVSASSPAFGPSTGAPASVGTVILPEFAAQVTPSVYQAPLAVDNHSANLSSQFWGTTVTNEVRVLRGETNAVNATPARVLVWPGAMAGEDYDPLNGIHYQTDYGTPTNALTNETQFIQMCRAIHCTAIMQVPAEIDNPSIAEEIVNYTEVNLSFTPAYWMIGNEPELWSHWKVPWKNWGSDFTNGPDPSEFGQEVVQYVNAIRQVDNTTPILGLPASGCTCGYYTFNQWISGVLKVTGDKIQAVAFHEYPAGWLGTGNGSLEAFYGTIQSSANIPTRIVAARAAVTSACPGCNVSVFISELGAALSWSTYGPYALGFSGALSIASQLTQAMDVNLTNIDLFATELGTTNSWFSPSGTARPDYTLYTSVLDHLGSQAFPVNVTGLGKTLYAIDTIAPNDANRRDLLVMNDNITQTISFEPKFAEYSGDAPVEVWSWNGSIHSTRANDTQWVEPYTTTPLSHLYPNGLPANYTLPPQSLVLFETFPAGSSYVNVAESGVPSPTPWYADVGGQFYTTTASNLSLLLPPGAYPVASTPIPLPIGGKELNPVEQLQPFPASPAVVRGPYTNLTVPFVPQWQVTVNASPEADGSVTPGFNGWWNSSQPLTVSAAPASGYAFVGWSGWGPGSYNGSDRSVTILPTGRVIEKARFVLGQEVAIDEIGLPTGTNWSVTVRGFTTSATSAFIDVFEPVGTYGYSVSPEVGYRSLPANGGFTVAGSLTLVQVQYVALTPPPPAYVVTFEVSGLPNPTPVSVTVRDLTETTGMSGPIWPMQFRLIDGTYAYQIGYIAGYHAVDPLKLFTVNGGPVTVTIPFLPTTYAVTWEANGTRAGLNWSVSLDGRSILAPSAWVSTNLTNGSYSYVIELPSNYTVSPRTGPFEITGAAVEFPLAFTAMEFSIPFEATGPAGVAGWSIRLGNSTQPGSSDGPSFLAPNGTYTFDVHAPAGYYAVPSHGTLTVAGDSPPVVIQFRPISELPSAALVAALTSGALFTSMWIGAAILLGFVTFRSLRRRGG